MGVGCVKADPNGMVMMNLSELKRTPGDSLEEKVEAVGGHIMSPDDHYRHTNTFGFVPDTKPQDTRPTTPIRYGYRGD